MTGSVSVRRRALRLALVALAGCAVLSGCGTSGGPAPTAPSAGGGSELGGRLPAWVTQLRFTDESGHSVRLADYADKTIVLGDILTLCQEHCPIDTAALVRVARQHATTAAQPSDTVFLSITVDPARDTPAQLAAYRKLYVPAGEGDLPQWHLLTAAPADLTRLWRYLHVYVQKVGEDGAVVRNWRTGRRLTYDVDHSDVVYFIGPGGRERYLLDGQPSVHAGTMPAAMQRFMSAAGHRNQTQGTWTVADALEILAWLGAPSG